MRAASAFLISFFSCYNTRNDGGDSMQGKQEQDFTKGRISHTILRLALPMTLAQLINVLYNIVDRMYIGRLPHVASHALAGVGITFPIITIVIAFANLAGMGGAPLFSIARGRKDHAYARTIMGNSFTLLLLFGITLPILILLFRHDLLYLFGASDTIYPYADAYISIYLSGSVFVMISLGMNSFINAQGFAKTGMLTVALGALVNIVLDPILIFTLNMGVQGAAVATVLSQLVSAVWVLLFLTKSSPLTLKLSHMRLKLSLVRRILTLGLSGFVMSVTNGLVQIVCNATLQMVGGDLYISVMTIINSLREVITLPVSGITNGSQPVMGYNYGAREYGRVRSCIRFMSIVCVLYMLVMWIVIVLTPSFFIRIFSADSSLLAIGIPAIQVYFFGYFMMAFQFSGQSTFVALNCSGYAIFFSLFRKVIIVVPLTLLLPQVYGLGVYGVFLAEPISNFIGGGICYLTMLLRVGRRLKTKEAASSSA